MRGSLELTEPLSVVQVAAVESSGEGTSWLVEGLWEEEGVGILGISGGRSIKLGPPCLILTEGGSPKGD